MNIHSDSVNNTGVVIATVGAAINDYALQLAGLLVTLLVAYWNHRSKDLADRKSEADRLDIRHERDRADFYLRKAARAEAELVRLRPEPAAITPPFPPGEACTDV